MNKVLYLACAIVLLILIAVGFTLYQYPLQTLIDTPAIGDFISSFGPIGMIGFIAASALFTAFGLPRQLVAFISGYAYGIVIGIAIGTLAAVFGAMLTYYFARKFARPFVLTKFPVQVALIDSFVREDLFLKILTLRFLPFGTNLATNLAAGATNVAIRPFMFATSIGFIPQMAIFVLTGHGIKVGSTIQFIIAAILGLISLSLGTYLYYRHRNKLTPAQ